MWQRCVSLSIAAPLRHFVAQDFGPVFEGKVRHHHQAFAFVGRRDDVKEELGPSHARDDVLKFVEGKEVELGQPLP